MFGSASPGDRMPVFGEDQRLSDADRSRPTEGRRGPDRAKAVFRGRRTELGTDQEPDG